MTLITCGGSPRRLRFSPFRPAALIGLLLLLGAPATRGQSLSLTLRQVPLREAFLQIEARTPYRFVYIGEELSEARPVSLSVVNAPVDSVLRLLLRGQPFSYSRLDTFIVIRQAPPGLPVPHLLRGRVLSEEGEGIAGASIRLRGSAAGTVADSSGGFALMAERKATLLVSAVGYGPAEVRLPEGGGTITLRRHTPVLDETVVTGYGRTTRRKATASVGKVHGRQLAAVPLTLSPLQSLQGRTPGLYLEAASGLPDAPLTVRIRGTHSLQSDSGPLFLIDGVPFLGDGTTLSRRSGLSALAPLHPVTAADIESVEVLKDAAATAIYGSRGAGGVVLITTRTPVEGKGELTVSLRHGWSRTGRSIDYLTTPRYLALRREAFQHDGGVPTPARAPDLTVWDTARDQRWPQTLLGGTALSLGAQVCYAGGRSGTAYALSGRYSREATVFPGRFAVSRTGLSARGHHRSTSGRLRVGTTLSGAGARYRLPAQDLTAYVALPPNLYDPYDREGRLRWREQGAGAGNPFALLHQPFTASFHQLTASSTISYRVLPRLEAGMLWGGQYRRFTEELRYPIAAQDPARNPRGSVSNGQRKEQAWVWEPSLHYRLPLGAEIKGSLLGGATLQDEGREAVLVSAGGYLDDALLGSPVHARTLSVEEDLHRYRYFGAYSRLTVEHRERYLLEGTLRGDGSSRFGPGRQFGLFGAAGAGWIFSREPWLQKRIPGLSYGKLRASWGTTGNDRIAEGAFRESWRPLPYPYGGGPAWKPERLYNPGFGWEVTRKWEGAVELGILKDRLLLTVAHYRHRSSNLILRTPVPAQTGFTSLLHNYPAVVDNRGWEGELSLSGPAGRPFLWSVTGQLTVPHNRLAAFPGLERTLYASTYATGRPLDNFRGYRYRGVDPQSGLYRFEDTNGDGQLSAADHVYTGTRDPALYGSVQGTLAWKGWSLSALVYGVRARGLHPVYTSGQAPGDLVNMPRSVEDRWPHDRRSPSYQRPTQDLLGEAYYPATFRVAQSSAVLTDASFIRLSTLQLSFSRKRKGEERAAGAWQWSLSAQNLITLTRYEGDPEVQSTSTLPLLRTVETTFCYTF